MTLFVKYILAHIVSGWRGRGKKMPIGTVVNEETPQEKQQSVSSREYKNRAKLSSHENSDEEDDDTTCKIYKIF